MVIGLWEIDRNDRNGTIPDHDLTFVLLLFDMSDVIVQNCLALALASI